MLDPACSSGDFLYVVLKHLLDLEKELNPFALSHRLTAFINQRPAWLDLAHRRLDAAVLDASGWPHDRADEQILQRLLALNLEREPA